MDTYNVGADIGYFKEEELSKYGTSDGMLRIFGNISIPGIDATSGSLGHGPGIGIGFALADKYDNLKRNTFVSSQFITPIRLILTNRNIFNHDISEFYC